MGVVKLEKCAFVSDCKYLGMFHLRLFKKLEKCSFVRDCKYLGMFHLRLFKKLENCTLYVFVKKLLTGTCMSYV